MLKAYKQTMSDAIKLADMSSQKQIASVTLSEYNRSLKGKSLTQIHGKEKADRIKEKISLSMSGEKNPAYGKSYENGGKSVKGHYKGFFFRSLLEYSFMKHLESQGIDLNYVKYESFSIPYEFEGRKRTYKIDFFVNNVAYEVKPSYALRYVTEGMINHAKWTAARQFFGEKGIEFQVVTEKDFDKVQFDTARLDENVVWKEGTLEYFKN